MATTKTSRTSTVRTFMADDLKPVGDLKTVKATPSLSDVRIAWRATGKSQAKRDLTISRYLTATGTSARDLAKATGWSRGTIGNAQRSGDLLARMITGGYVPSVADAADTAEVARWNADRLTKAAPKGLDKMTGGALRDALRKMIEQTGKQHAKNATGARKSQTEKGAPKVETVAGVETSVPDAVLTLATAEGVTAEIQAAAALRILANLTGSMVSVAYAEQIAEHAARILKDAKARQAVEDAKADEAATVADDEAAPEPKPRRTRARKSA